MLTGNEWLALSLSGLLLIIAGIWHLAGLRIIRRINRAIGKRANLSVLLAFWSLALLHFSEIAIAAMVYFAATQWFGLGEIAGGYGDSAGGLLYFSGINFATLGYSQQVVTGPLRLMVMMQALAGFMLITWSATFVYSIWGEFFRDADD